MDDVQEMVMVIGSHQGRGMQHGDVVREDVAKGYATNVCSSVWLTTMCVCRKAWCERQPKRHRRTMTGPNRRRQGDGQNSKDDQKVAEAAEKIQPNSARTKAAGPDDAGQRRRWRRTNSGTTAKQR